MERNALNENDNCWSEDSQIDQLNLACRRHQAHPDHPKKERQQINYDRDT